MGGIAKEGGGGNVRIRVMECFTVCTLASDYITGESYQVLEVSALPLIRLVTELYVMPPFLAINAEGGGVAGLLEPHAAEAVFFKEVLPCGPASD